MIDDCKVERAEGATVNDPATGRDTQPKTLIYPTPAQVAEGNPGRCQIQSFTGQAAQPTSAEHRFTVERLTIKLPVGTPVQPGDLVTITRSTMVPNDVGRVFKLVELERKSMPTAARWNVEVVTA
jgi:hypothetical protein